jgi:hypothetical protein
MDVINSIEDSDEFKDFIRKNPHYYLVHVFRIIDNDVSSNWQIGYYSKDTDKIVVFEYNNDLVMMHHPEDALKKEEYISKLEFRDFKISEDDASRICEDILNEKYPKELSNKKIFLLQNLPEYGNVWNVTIVTLAFSIINVKIEADSGMVLKHSKENLMEWNR